MRGGKPLGIFQPGTPKLQFRCTGPNRHAIGTVLTARPACTIRQTHLAQCGPATSADDSREDQRKHAIEYGTVGLIGHRARGLWHYWSKVGLY